MPIPSSTYHKSRSNIRFTDEEENEVRRAMDEASNKLRAVEGEAARLRDKLAVLNQRKKDTEHFIKVHEGLLSPIRRLLPEILQEIFCLCLPNAHNSVLSCKEAPLLLGRVCSQWRQITYSTPELWSSLHIAITPSTWPAAEARLEAVDAWLSRSGILPLSISMSTLMLLSLDCPVSLHDFRPYFSLIAKYAQRWKYIHFQAEDWDPMCLLTEMDADDFPLLEVFHIQGGNPTTGSYPKKGGIFSAPLLRNLSVHPYSLQPVGLPVNWGNLTGLDSSLSNLSDIFQLLSLCPHLETCTLRGGLSTPSQPSDSWPKVVLPKLRTLIIRAVEPVHNDTLFAILINLFTPALRYFSCRLFNWFPPQLPNISVPEHISPSEVMSSFFQRLNEPLEELNLYAYTGETNYLVELLSLFPGLKRLSVNCSYYIIYSPGKPKKLFNDHLLSGFIPYERRNHWEGEQAEVGVSAALASSTCLCPNLEVLDVTGARCSKHIMLEFLHSRLVDHDKYGIARLRRFRISFDSEWDNDDMAGEIDRLAEKSGSLVKLEHSPAPTPKPRHYFSFLDRDPFIKKLPVF